MPSTRTKAKAAMSAATRRANAERIAAYRAAISDAGGRQVAVHLSPQAVADLEHIKARDGVNGTEAVIAALRAHALRRPRKNTPPPSRPWNARKGFASIPPQRRSEISSMGGKAAHARGVAHEFTPEEAAAAGRKSRKNAPETPE